jgi:hypothetical protein
MDITTLCENCGCDFSEEDAHENKALHKALEQECSDLETLIEEIKETT